MHKVHYAWVICVIGFLAIFVTIGEVSNGFSIFLPFIMKEHGLTHMQTSSLVTIRCIFSFLSMLCVGFYYKKLSLRQGIALAVAITGIAYFIYALAHTYLQFCIGAGLSGLSYGFGSMIPISILMSKWFTKHRSLALGICSAGSGLATIILPLINTFLIEAFTLSTAFFAEAAGSMVIFALAQLLLRNTPKEKGLKSYGYEETETCKRGGSKLTPDYKMSLAEWILLCSICLTMGALANPGFSHLSALYTSAGFSAMSVASIISCIGLLTTLGKIGYGMISDRIGGKRTSILFGIILLAGHILCCLTFLHSVPVLVVNVVFIGVGYPLPAVGPSIWSGVMSSPLHYALAVRRAQLSFSAGAMIFAGIPGIIADHTGSYIPAYIMFSVLLLVSLVLLAIAFRLNTCRKCKIQ